MFKAVIFDMDGLLIDSEILWQAAEKRVLRSVGVNLTEEMCRSIVGWRLDDIIKHYYDLNPWTGASLKEIESRVTEVMLELIEKEGKPKPGIFQALNFVKGRGLKVALASGSYLQIIDAVLKRLNLTDFFGCICSSENELKGKPDPAVYLTAAKKLNVSPKDCLAVEDSFNGMLSAEAAEMTCLVVPDSSLPPDPRLKHAQHSISSLSYFDEKLWMKLETASYLIR